MEKTSIYNKIKYYSIITAILSLCSSCIGLFYSNGGNRFIVQNIYGDSVELYGDGIYAYNSILKVGATKGTDLAILIIAVLLLLFIFVFGKVKGSKLIQCGLLSCLLYNSSCLIFGVSFNRMFLIYLVQFSFSFFAFILLLSQLFKEETFEKQMYSKKLKGTALFLIIGGFSVLVWMSFILPAVIFGNPMETIEIYTTEPTFIIDLGIILPSTVWCGISLLNKKKQAYTLSTIILTLLTGVGLCVIGQTIMQTSLSLELPIGQLIGLVGSFLVLGIIAIFLNIRLLKSATTIHQGENNYE